MWQEGLRPGETRTQTMVVRTSLWPNNSWTVRTYFSPFCEKGIGVFIKTHVILTKAAFVSRDVANFCRMAS